MIVCACACAKSIKSPPLRHSRRRRRRHTSRRQSAAALAYSNNEAIKSRPYNCHLKCQLKRAACASLFYGLGRYRSKVLFCPTYVTAHTHMHTAHNILFENQIVNGVARTHEVLLPRALRAHRPHRTPYIFNANASAVSVKLVACSVQPDA